MALTKKLAAILRAEIRLHAYLYYTLDDAWTTDESYDTLWRMLKRHEIKAGIPDDSPTTRVGEAIWKGFVKPGTTREQAIEMLKDLHEQKAGRKTRA